MYAATLGCKINQYETQAITEAWRAGGFESTEQAAEADVILVNSCAVTAHAVADLRKTVRKLHRENPEAGIIVTGCAAQVLREELAELPGVMRVVPQADKAELLQPHAETFSISDYPRARAVVMVQDGCSHGCTYCIVPLTRGPSRSRAVAKILDEAEHLLESGFRELILSGVNLRQFGRDLPGQPDFWDLLRLMEQRLAPAFAGRARLRLSSVEPGQLGDKALETLAVSRLICPHLHLSLQAGDPGVLRAMGRGHYHPRQAEEFLERLREVWPLFGLGADLLTGFPGETEAQFATTLEFCRRLPLSYAHVFPYSSRPGTAAAKMRGKVPVEEKKRRAALLRALVAKKKAAFLQRLSVEPRLNVLVQDKAGNGVCEFYSSCVFASPSKLAQPRAMVAVRPVRVGKGKIWVEPVSKPVEE